MAIIGGIPHFQTYPDVVKAWQLFDRSILQCSSSHSSHSTVFASLRVPLSWSRRLWKWKTCPFFTIPVSQKTKSFMCLSSTEISWTKYTSDRIWLRLEDWALHLVTDHVQWLFVGLRLWSRYSKCLVAIESVVMLQASGMAGDQNPTIATGCWVERCKK